jgi:hypothetical protein
MDLSGAFPNHIITSSGEMISHENQSSSIENVVAADGEHQDLFDNTAPAPIESPSTFTTALRFRGSSAPPAAGSNASAAVEEDEDEDEDEDEEEVTSNMMREIIDEQNRRRSQWMTRESLLYWSIHLTTLFWNYSSLAAYYVFKAAQGAYRGVQNQTFYFFEHSTVPYNASHVKLNSPGTPTIEWTYDFDSRVFRKSESTDEMKHLPFLTAEIYHEGLSLYDLTEFVQSIHYSGTVAPTAHHILGAWFLHTGILLDTSLPMSLKVFTEEGEEVVIPLRAAGST